MAFAGIGNCDLNGNYNVIQTATNGAGQMVFGTASVSGSSSAVVAFRQDPSINYDHHSQSGKWIGRRD